MGLILVESPSIIVFSFREDYVLTTNVYVTDNFIVQTSYSARLSAMNFGDGNSFAGKFLAVQVKSSEFPIFGWRLRTILDC